MQRPTLAPGHVDLWVTRIDLSDKPILRKQYRKLLSQGEHERADRLKLPRVRSEYLVARSLVRHVLSHYADVPPNVWSFVQNAYGKPIVSAPWSGFTAFNLSHSAGMVVCAVTAEGHIGVDVESLQRKTTGIDLARRFFSTAEVAMLEACPPEQQHEKFLQIWTLKEAFIKAIGHGLSFPLAKFSMSLPTDGAPAIQFATGHQLPSEETSLDWRFAQIRSDTQHHLSLAVAFPQSQELVVTTREVVPLADDSPDDKNRTDEVKQPLICHRANHWYVHQSED